MCKIYTSLFKHILSAFEESADIPKSQYELFLFLTLRQSRPAYETVSRYINNQSGYKLGNDILGHIQSNKSWIYDDSPYAQAIKKSDDNHADDALRKALCKLHTEYLPDIDIPGSCDGILGNLTRFCFCGNHERISALPPAEPVDFGPPFDSPSPYWDKRNIKNFVKRTGCISEIRKNLEQQDLIILNGAAGIGKTSIIKYYYVEYCRNAPIDFFYVQYANSLDDTIKKIQFKNVGKASDKWEMLSLKRGNSLLVIDDMNCLPDDLSHDLERLKTLHLKIIVITRVLKIPNPFAVIHIDPMDNNALSELYIKILPETENDNKQLEKLFALLEWNTLAVSLAAKLAAKQKYSIGELIHVLQDPDSLKKRKGDTFKHSYSDNSSLGYIGHIRRIYSLHSSYLPDYCRAMLGPLSCFMSAPVPRALINDWIKKSVHGYLKNANDCFVDDCIKGADNNWIGDALNRWVRDALNNQTPNTADTQKADILDQIAQYIIDNLIGDAFCDWLKNSVGCWIQSMEDIGIFSETTDSYVQMHQLVAEAIFYVERPDSVTCRTLIDTVHDTVLKLKYSLELPNIQKLIYESIINLSPSVTPYNNKGQKSPSKVQENWWYYVMDCIIYLLTLGEKDSTVYLLKSLYAIDKKSKHDHPFYIFKMILEFHASWIGGNSTAQPISTLEKIQEYALSNKDILLENPLGYALMTGYLAATVFDKLNSFTFYSILPAVQYQALCPLYNIGAVYRQHVQASPTSLDIFYEILEPPYLTNQELDYYKCVYKYLKLNTAAYNLESLSELVEMTYKSYSPYFDRAVRMKYFCSLMALHSACIFFNTTGLQDMAVHDSHINGLRRIEQWLDLEISEASVLPAVICNLCTAAYYHYAYCTMDAKIIAHAKDKVTECYAKAPCPSTAEADCVLNIFSQMSKTASEYHNFPQTGLWYIWLSSMSRFCRNINAPN